MIVVVIDAGAKAFSWPCRLLRGRQLPNSVLGRLLDVGAKRKIRSFFETIGLGWQCNNSPSTKRWGQRKLRPSP